MLCGLAARTGAGAGAGVGCETPLRALQVQTGEFLPPPLHCFSNAFSAALLCTHRVSFPMEKVDRSHVSLESHRPFVSKWQCLCQFGFQRSRDRMCLDVGIPVEQAVGSLPSNVYEGDPTTGLCVIGFALWDHRGH